MERNDIIERFCNLSSKVMKCFDDMEPADCICKPTKDPYFQYSSKILEFIEKAVERAIDVNLEEQLATDEASVAQDEDHDKYSAIYDCLMQDTEIGGEDLDVVTTIIQELLKELDESKQMLTIRTAL